MKALLAACIMALCFAQQASPQTETPRVVAGTIQRIAMFPSEYVTPRNIDIWLPDGYTDTVKYAVLYMHDGQMLFDPAQSWNKQAWEVDDVATQLMAGNVIRKLIVVGIWNGGSSRHADYFPQIPYQGLSQTQKDTVLAQLRQAGRATHSFEPRSDGYLKFITEELMPYIEKNFSVDTSRESTFIAGSSMGGLITMYALCQYPEVFGGAACLSTHWPGTFTLQNNVVPQAFLEYFEKHLPPPGNHKIYFDYGDQTLDALYPAIQQQADSILLQKGFDAAHWTTRFFPGHDHSEKSWSQRLHIPLTFLFSE